MRKRDRINEQGKSDVNGIYYYCFIFEDNYEPVKDMLCYPGSDDDAREVEAQIESGDLLRFDARVEVSLYEDDDMKPLGSDFLGANLYKTYAEFLEGDYASDMLREAVRQANESRK